MSRSSFLLSGRLDEYYRQVGYREPALLTALRRQNENMPEAVMQIAPEQGQLMQLLVRLAGVRRAIEVGVFTGYSSLCVALALPEDGYLLACDVNRQWTDIARQYWSQAGVSARIELRLGPALDTLNAELEGEFEPYDMAFIDADKCGYQDYFECCLQLLRPGGLILIDNVLWSGRVADPDETGVDTEALRQFNARLVADERVDLCMVPIADGLSLCWKR